MAHGKAALGATALFLLLTGCVRHVVHHYPPPPRAAATPPPPPPAPPADEDLADPTPFREPLRPYGRWLWEEPHGWVWVPRVAREWRPYCEGRWVYTDAHGWYWNSDEPWGWAVYHYGRWYLDDRHGWAWVPGSVWGPAWVAWRGGGGFVGWAPLPPAVGFAPGVGPSFARFDVSVGIPAPAWMFVPERAILAPRIREEVLLPPRNVTIIHNTTNVTNITVVDNRVVNHGIPPGRVEKVTGRPVPRRRVREIGSADELGGRPEAEDTVPVFRPKIAKAKARARGQAEKPSRDGAEPDSPPAEEEATRDLEAGQPRSAETIDERHPGEKGGPPSRVDSEKVRKREEKELRQEREKAERERKVEERREAREERKREKDEPAPPASKPAAPEGEIGDRNEAKQGDLGASQAQSAETTEERHPREKTSPPAGVDSEKLRKREEKELRQERERAEHERKVEERREAREERKGKGTASAPSERGGEKEPPASRPARKKKN